MQAGRFLILLAMIGALGACTQTYQKPRMVTDGQMASMVTPDADPNFSAPGGVKVVKQRISCVPYARAISGVEVRGDAWTWWDGAAGVYDRGKTPEIGAVMVMKKGNKLSRGHVAVVTAVVSSREVVVDHANWRPGELHLGARVIDVSHANDWSEVRVWYPPIGDYGTGRYALAGFVYPRSPEL